MEKIAYRPRNVRETLVELKDASELAIDLAYAAALYGHEGLAEAVYELEAEAESLQYPAKISLMLAAKRADDAEELVGIIQIVDAAVAITNAAADIAGIVANDIGLPEEVRAALPEADEVVMRASVADGSSAVGQSLADLALETETGVDVTAVRRDSKWIITPDDEIKLQAGDLVIGSGPDDGVATAYELLTGEERPAEPRPQTDVEELRQAAETVIRLKNIAELAVGLSYGAVLFDDDELAAEVTELEEQSDRLKGDIETWVIEASERVGKPSQLRGVLHLATASEAICDAARDIADIVLREGDVHPVFGQAVSESDELITTTTITADSDFADRSLETLELEERTGMGIMAIRRSDDWILAPAGETTLRTGDVLIARGPEEGVREIKQQTLE
ncbi:MAG: potassium channel family protein [Halolamina sp.]